MRYKIYFSFVIAGRVQKNDIIEDWEKPRFGFYWWFFIPVFRSNGGKFKQGHCVDISLKFLCFSFGLTFYPKFKSTRGNHGYIKH